MRRLALIGLTSLAAVVATTTAFAYILPAGAILASVASRREQLAYSSLALEGHKRSPGAPASKISEVFVGKAHRLEIVGSDGSKSVYFEDGKKLWTSGGAEAKTISAEQPSLVHLCFGGQTDDLRKRLTTLIKKRGVDTEIVSLSRLNHTISYVVGANPGELDKPQLWVSKDGKEPVRFIWKTVDGKIRDVRFLDFGSAQTNDWFPRKIEIYEDGELVETTEYTNVKVNHDVDEDLLRPPASS